MSDMQSGTAYDRVAYPSGVFVTTHPDHLATIARLHGLHPPSPETARVLEIGGGDGMNLIAMAAAYPDAEFLSFDLAQAPVARGQAIIAASGLTNIRVEMGDIMDASETLEGPFDYISAHGVYAWVPGPVRDALLALVSRVLSPEGVAFISYNALPGGHFRRVIREMTLHHIKGISDPDARIAAAAAFLKAYAVPQPGDRPLITALREVARPISTKVGQVLFHDELGDVFEPQAFSDVAEAASRHGLRFLNEAEPGRIDQGLPDADLDETALIDAVQADDYENACFFHQTLFVRSECAPARRPAIGAIADLYASARCTRTGPTDFTSQEGTFGISDLPLADAVAKLGEAWPRRIRVGDLVQDELRLEAVYRLFLGKALMLHATPLPGVAEPGDRPRISALAQALLTLGEERLFTLDHRAVLLDEPAPRAFLALLDGSRDWATIEADWASSGHAVDTDAATALSRFASVPLLVA